MRSYLALAAILSLVFAGAAFAKPAPKESEVARLITLTRNCQDKIPVARSPTHKHVPWKMNRHSLSWRVAVEKRWEKRLRACRAFLRERARQWNWQVFPRWIIALGVCESGGSGQARSGEPNWWAEGSSSDGTFYSAFNIGRTRYDGAAHKMGVRGWREGPGVPSPYEQAMAVIGYVRLYGDGFTGRCHGIARSSW